MELLFTITIHFYVLCNFMFFNLRLFTFVNMLYLYAVLVGVFILFFNFCSSELISLNNLLFLCLEYKQGCKSHTQMFEQAIKHF